MPDSRIRTLAALTCSAALAATVVATAPAADARASGPLACSITGAVSGLPFKASPKDPGNPVYDFMQFTATRNGVYAGIAYRSASSDFYLLTRSPGKRPVVLRKVHYPYAHATPNAVTAMGFTPAMNLVVAVQNTWYKPGRIAFGSYKGLYYTGRTAHYLAAGRNWISYMPTSVADSGRVAGWAATGSPTAPHYSVVTWSSVTSAPTVLADVGSAHPSVHMTGNGDIAWQGSNGLTVVRRSDGSMTELNIGTRAESVGMWPAGASKDTVFVAGINGVFSFPITNSNPSGQSVQGRRLTTVGSPTSAWIDTVGPRGDLVTGMLKATLRLADGRQVALPAQALPASAPSRVISTAGTVAFTSAKDRKVHFLTCR